MIRVQPAEEPATFDALVRQPGLRKLAKRVGAGGTGRGRPLKNIYRCREEIPSEEFPKEWRKALPELSRRYHQLCAYAALYIEEGTGDATVDHFVPVSADWRTAYEWSNYRLACGLVNTAKRLAQPLDPFKIEDDWFALELVGFQVEPGDGTVDPLRSEIRTTIKVLDLNCAALCLQRSSDAENFFEGHISLEYLRRRAPLVARELGRQGRLRACQAGGAPPSVG